MIRIAWREGFSAGLADKWPGGLVPPEWTVTEHTAWTPDLVREVLPNIPVVLFSFPNKGTATGIVKGRLNSSATVYVDLPGGAVVTVDVAWQSLANILNAGASLII